MQPFNIDPYFIVDKVLPGEIGQTALVRGPKPSTFVMRQLFRQFKTVINLEVGWAELFFDDEHLERDVCKQIDVSYLHKPMSNIWRPDPHVLKWIVARIHYELQNGNVLVHCLHGEDRTGIVCAAWRIIHNDWPVKAAIQEMYAQGFHKIPYWYWVPVLKGLK